MELIKDFRRPLPKLVKIHSISYRHLLPPSVNKYTTYLKFFSNGKSYDLYGYLDDTLVDIYPTHKSILSKNDLPSSWISYIKQVLLVTNMKKIDICVYNLKLKKFTNVIHIRSDIEILEDDEKNIYTVNNRDWVSASSIKNYIMEDTILDVLNKKRKRTTDDETNVINYKTTSEEDDTDELIRMDMGNKFEVDIIDNLIRKYFTDFTKIGESYEAKSTDKYNLTLSEMKKGTPIIHQAVLHNHEKQEYGCVDLLIRGDWINKIFTMEYQHLLHYCNKISMTNYVIVDIKFNRLELCVDGMTIRNKGMIKVYKSQLCIYNNALGVMQGYLPQYAYILGSGWELSKLENGIKTDLKSNDPFDRCGVIDFVDKDLDVVSKTEEASKWVKELNSNEFDENKPKYYHNYPNMSNNYDHPHKKRKKSIAEENNELTLISYLTPKNRKIGIENGIDNYLHKDISVEKLGLKGKTGLLVETLLNNQKKLDIPISGSYKVPDMDRLELFMDYEFIPVDNYYVHEMIPYLCGIGHMDPDTNTWSIDQIILDSNDEQSLREMCVKKIEVLKKLSNNFENKIRIYTWTDTDKRIFVDQCKKFNLLGELKNFDTMVEWLDGYKFCKDNRINFKDAKGFNLKEIGRILNKHNLTDVNWKNNLSKSSGSRKHYVHNKKWVEKQSVLYYNEIDCQIIYEIFRNLRKYQINI